MNVPILSTPEQRWECPSCSLQQVTRRSDVHTEFHHCAGLNGLWAPMVPEGTRCKVETHERDDFIAGEKVQLHEGRPVMNLVVTRDDGQDCVVYAPSVNVQSSME